MVRDQVAPTGASRKGGVGEQASLGAHADGDAARQSGGFGHGGLNVRPDVFARGSEFTARRAAADSASGRSGDEHGTQRAAEWAGRVFVPNGVAEGTGDRGAAVVSLSGEQARTTVPAGCADCAGGVDAIVCSYSWPCDEALRVVYGPTPTCPTGESGGNWSAENGPNIGGFQVNIDAHPYTREQMLDPEQNIAAAYGIWLDSGGNWSAWSCRP